MELVHFLLIEDNDAHAELLEQTFEANRFTNKISHVPSADLAIKFLRQEAGYEDAERPHVILLDLNLPGMSGLEFLELVKSDPEYKAIPVVVLTTSSSPTDLTRAYELYANSYLTKPVDFGRFAEMVDHLNLYWGVMNVSPD